MRNIWPGARSIAVWLILLIILSSTIIRFVKLESAPLGFFIDEGDGAVHIICLGQTGHDGSGVRYPLFSEAGAGGYFSPTHLYLGVIWTKIFGHSIFAIRAMAAFVTSMAMLGLFFLAQNLMDQRAALFVVLAACVSPWAFPFARQSMDDPTLFPLGLIWGTYYFLRSQKLRDALLSAIFFSVAFYSYPPARAQIPLFGLALLAYKKYRRGISVSFLSLFMISGVLLCLPLIQMTLSGQMLVRYNVVGIFSPWHRARLGTDTPWGALSVFIKNMLIHLNPKFLFVTGDANLRHSSQFSGELSWLDDFALIIGIPLFIKAVMNRKKAGFFSSIKNFMAKTLGKGGPSTSVFNATFLLFLAGFIAGLIPAALTWEALPHALRAVGCWPFICLMTGFIIWKAEPVWKATLPLAAAIAATFGILYMHHYFKVYPQLSEAWFDSQIKELAIETQKTGDWKRFLDLLGNYGSGPQTRRYYLIHYGHKTCEESLRPIQ